MSQSAYELLRDANIAKNNEVLRGLGLIGSSLTGLQHSTIPNPKPVRVGPPRRSKRKRDLEVVQPPLTANVMDEVDDQEEKPTLKAICFKPATNPRRWALDPRSAMDVDEHI
jgi:hypothetical protein